MKYLRCTKNLGGQNKLKQIDYLTHKLGHFGVGAFKGAISNLIQREDVLEGALVGGAAAAGAEILGEKLIKVQEIRNEVIQEAIDERRPIVGDEYIAEVNRRINLQTDFIKIAMAGVAAIAGQNPHLGADCAANALENNFLAHIVGGAAGGLAVALEAAGVVEAGAVANVIWGALGTGILITGCQVAQDNLPGSSPFEESPWINGPIINGTPIADAIPALEGYQPAPQDYDTTITITPVADAVGENEGYQAAPQDVLNYKLPGFTPVDVPGTFILMNEGVEGAVDRVRAFELKHNKKAIQNMTDGELAQNLADRAERINPGAKGAGVGREKHLYAEKVFKRYQDMTGERVDLLAEVRYKDGQPWEPNMGLKGSIKPDLYNKRTNEVFDYKFGDAKVTNGQRARYEANLPSGSSPVVQVKPNTSINPLLNQ